MASPGSLLEKDPDASELYEMDWSDWLPTGETITTSTWLITGPDNALTSDNDSIMDGSTSTRVRLVGGTIGDKYVVTNRIVTAGTPAQNTDRSFTLLIRQQ